MDKKALNNEIILCRAAVRKARVAVIRKLIRKIKILKSCKKEGVKEKKLKKSERLFKKVQIMKKAKDDDVTRFALRNADLEKFIKGTKVDLRQNALACLAKHVAVIKKVNTIKEKIPNWEVELPLLLNSLGKKKKRQRELSEKEKEKEKKPCHLPKEELSDAPKQKKLDQKSTEKQEKLLPRKNKVLEQKKLEKVDDPFFMGKKVIAPLHLDNSKDSINKKVEIERDRFNKDCSGLAFNARPFKAKKELHNPKNQTNIFESEEKLHPSWAAKKVKLIKPFEGKKIKFSEE